MWLIKTEQHKPVKQTQVTKQNHEDDEDIFPKGDTDDSPIEGVEGLPTNDIMSGVTKVAAEGLKEILFSPETRINTFSLLNSLSSVADSSDQGKFMMEIMRPILNEVLNGMTKRSRKVSKERRIPGSKQYVDRHELHEDQMISLLNQVIPLLREAVTKK